MAENKVRFLRGTAAEYANAVKDDDTFYYTTDDEKFYVGSKEITGGGITVDSELSDTSTNPVQGNVIKQAIDNKADKSLYGDTIINVGRKAGTIVGEYSTAEGLNTTASGYASHAEGSNAYISNGEIAFYDTRAVTISDDVTVEVDSSKAYGVNSHAEGSQTLAYGDYSHAEGRQTTASGGSSHAEGDQTTASGGDSHAEGFKTIASGAQSHAEGISTTASGGRSHAEGSETIASGGYCHAEGWRTTANGNNSCHAEGFRTTACGIATHVEGSSSNKATDLIPDLSWSSTTNDDIINAWNTQKFSLAHGRASHVEGHDNLTLGYASHAEGQDTVAIGDHSHTSGYFTKALHENEAACGKYNISNSDTLFSIGDGTADDARHNAFEITTTGGKLHDKNIVTDDMSLPANGGNADTVDGLHANDFIYPRAMLSNVDLNTILYPCSALIYGDCTNMPPVESWGTLLCYSGGTGSHVQLWATATDSSMFKRHYDGARWSDWKEISTTPIKSTGWITTPTNEYGKIILPNSDSRIYISVIVTGCYNQIYMDNGNYVFCVTDGNFNPQVNTAVSYIAFYIE